MRSCSPNTGFFEQPAVCDSLLSEKKFWTPDHLLYSYWHLRTAAEYREFQAFRFVFLFLPKFSRKRQPDQRQYFTTGGQKGFGQPA